MTDYPAHAESNTLCLLRTGVSFIAWCIILPDSCSEICSEFAREFVTKSLCAPKQLQPVFLQNKYRFFRAYFVHFTLFGGIVLLLNAQGLKKIGKGFRRDDTMRLDVRKKLFANSFLKVMADSVP